ncbi:MAG TPA: RNA methyltransferase [Opitutaceae bacterium]
MTRAQLQLLRSLREKRGREEHGLYVVEGEKIVGELLAAGHTFIEVFATPHWKGTRTQDASETDMAKASHFPTPSPVLAVGRIRREPLGLRELANGLTLALDGVQDPGNAGAIVRVAEAFGASGAVFLKGTVNPYNPKCVRGSVGSVFRVPLVSAIQADEILGLAEIAWYAAMPRAQKLVSDANLAAPCGIIIGSEGHGVGPVLAARATGLRIPTSGVESLNAAVAAGILLYEARRQRASGLVRGTQ